PCRSHKPSRFKTGRTKFFSRLRNARQGFLVVQVVELTFLLRVKSCQKLVVQTFFRTARAFVEIPVNSDFMTVSFQTPKPRHKLPVAREESLMMIIRHDEKGTDAHTATG